MQLMQVFNRFINFNPLSGKIEISRIEKKIEIKQKIFRYFLLRSKRLN